MTLWTKSEKVLLENLWNQEVKMKKMQSILNRTKKSISTMRKKLGLKPRFSGNEGTLPWTTLEVSKLTDMWKSGIGIKIIAHKLNRTEKSIYNMKMKLGLHSRCTKKGLKSRIHISITKEQEFQLRKISQESGCLMAAVCRIFIDQGITNANKN
jgi:hypothetical protein